MANGLFFDMEGKECEVETKTISLRSSGQRRSLPELIIETIEEATRKFDAPSTELCVEATAGAALAVLPLFYILSEAEISPEAVSDIIVRLNAIKPRFCRNPYLGDSIEGLLRNLEGYQTELGAERGREGEENER